MSDAPAGAWVAKAHVPDPTPYRDPGDPVERPPAPDDPVPPDADPVIPQRDPPSPDEPPAPIRAARFTNHPSRQ
ncbi:MAG TPA: hypothetical protein VLN59_01110 [Burkholderiales bacterium]|nr:hypothetical protein [Burkholderiales bacterium]